MSYPAPHPVPQPTYGPDAWEWFEERLALQDIELHRVDDMNTPVAASRTTRRIWVPASAGFRTAYRRGTQALLYVVRGTEWAPEFGQSYEEPDAKIVPFPRPYR